MPFFFGHPLVWTALALIGNEDAGDWVGAANKWAFYAQLHNDGCKYLQVPPVVGTSRVPTATTNCPRFALRRVMEEIVRPNRQHSTPILPGPL
jgi:hypothetical protein